MFRGKSVAALSAFLVALLTVLLSNCNNTHHGPPPPPPVPVIQNIDFATTPSSAVNWSIEINGTGFQGTPGQVVFTQGANIVNVVPTAPDWTSTGIVAAVPSTGFTVPGTASVTVVTTGGTSNALNLNLVSPVTLNTNVVTWTTTTALPTAMSGLGAVAVPGVAGPPPTAYIVVAGGFDGTNDSTQVLSNTLNANGTVGASWTSIATNALPSSRAHFGMVEADDTNSLVPVGSRFIYVIGGQQTATDLPGGTTTVYMASVNTATGAVGSWTALSSALPATVVGPAATIYNGHIYVVGGLDSSGNHTGAVYVATVNNDGTLGAWSTSANAYPTAVSFATVFGFSENLYVIDGDTNTSTDPNHQAVTGTTTVELAPAHFGLVGAWTSTSPSVANREKHDTWHIFDQVIDPEGTYIGTIGTQELEQTTVNSGGTLAAWAGINSGPQQIGANVFNAAAVVSPLLSPTSTGVLSPRVLLIGGAAFSASSPGLPLSSSVFYNNAP
ncbi:MAG TPA: hypothetical protein VJN21_11715 [Candidatus Acidoferrales bacterium]|nr:hypothetical protein [Candidatus Acidoferrales bacterium]